MFYQDPGEAHDRSDQKDDEEPRGPGAALYHGSNQEQEKSIEHEMCEIVMQESGSEQPPVFVINLTAVGQSAEANEKRIISNCVSREFEKEHGAHSTEDSGRSEIGAHLNLKITDA